MKSDFPALIFVLTGFIILILGCISPEVPVCGNGVCETGETSESCPIVDGGDCPPVSLCGNGLVENGEQCDDGNDIDSDSCTNECRNANTETFCGDGICSEPEIDSECLEDCYLGKLSVNGNGFFTENGGEAEVLFKPNKPVSNLRVKISNEAGELLLEEPLVLYKEGSYSANVDFSGINNDAYLTLNDETQMLFSYESDVSNNPQKEHIVPYINTQEIRTQIVKQSSNNNKILIAVVTKEENISFFDLVEVAGVIASESNAGLLTFNPFDDFEQNFEVVVIKDETQFNKSYNETLLAHEIIQHEYNAENQVKNIIVLNLIDSPNPGIGGTGGFFTEEPTCKSNISKSPIIIYEFSSRYPDLENEYTRFLLGRIFSHEFGHYFADLGDEYYYQVITISDNYYNIDREACPKWCSGELNPQKQCYSNYLNFKTCSSQYLDAQGYIKPDNLNDVQNCLNQALPTDKDNPCINFDSWEFGTSCQPNTACYFSANGYLQWRANLNTIMRNNLATQVDFGRSSQKIMEILQCLTT